MDHGIDWLGDNSQPEELNHIEKGKRYGWPYIYADGQVNPHLDPPGGVEKSDWAKSSKPMALGYTAHAAPMQLSFYNASQFPAEFRGDAFISMHGSWNRRPASGYEVVRIRFRQGSPVAIEPFITGFLTDRGESGRPFGNAVAKDGSLLFTDDRNGVIYRVSYAGASAEQGAAAPALTMSRQTEPKATSPLAIESLKAQPTGKLTVTSPAFQNGAAMPVIYSSYDQNVSPPLSWTAGPEGTKTYAVVMEDPDAKTMPTPVVHWLVWNIPSINSLREGLPGIDRMDDPKGLRQGVNSMGITGYKGPRPPAGDPAHHYHVEVFAFERELDLPLGASREDFLRAAQGHVLASGELIGVFARPDRPAKP